MTADRVTLFESGSPGSSNSNFGAQSDSSIVFFENIKTAKEEEEMHDDDRGLNAADRLQMLCDGAARAAANTLSLQRFQPVNQLMCK